MRNIVKKIFTIFLFPFLFLLSGCSSSGFDRGPISNVQNHEVVIDDSEIKKYLSLKPQLKFPFRLGVYILDSQSDHYRIDSNNKSTILEAEKTLKLEGILSQMFLITESIYDLDGSNNGSFRNYYKERTKTLDNIKKIRILAARYGADAVLVVKPKNAFKKEANFLSMFYLTIVGIWLVPGSYRDSVFSFQGTLWDVRNEYLYLTAESESEKSVTRPLGWVDDDALVKESKEAALKEFYEELMRRFRSLK
ncbi:putative lipoprotein [Leptospira broomii serovar Hurstbridge str. 5399]|uniref:Lipoprotein n=1 Tax=Leptospira broomii serovar Hurstbridge str. 5399 TaxID=1049789 RepID=T0F528_9LEPT|nr:putative lipoprotein [Leptospira broomii serovar Hurstbridge str. 5399]